MAINNTDIQSYIVSTQYSVLDQRNQTLTLQFTKINLGMKR